MLDLCLLPLGRIRVCDLIFWYKLQPWQVHLHAADHFLCGTAQLVAQLGWTLFGAPRKASTHPRTGLSSISFFVEGHIWRPSWGWTLMGLPWEASPWEGGGPFFRPSLCGRLDFFMGPQGSFPRSGLSSVSSSVEGWARVFIRLPGRPPQGGLSSTSIFVEGHSWWSRWGGPFLPPST